MRKTIRAKATEGRYSSFSLHPSALFRRRGFSFTEVLFAVIILGIGFIMVAAIFPAAIQQGKLTNDETNAAAIARGAFNAIDQMQNTGTLLMVTSSGTNSMTGAPYPGRVYSFRNPQPTLNSSNPQFTQLPTTTPPDELWNKLSGNFINEADHRFAWVGLYRRDGYLNPSTGTITGASGYAQIFVVPVQVQNRSVFDQSDYYSSSPPPATGVYNLQPRPVIATVVNDGAGPGIDAIGFNDQSGAPAMEKAMVASVAEGGYVIVADDNLPGDTRGQLNGNIFRLGARRPDLDTNTSVFPQQRTAYELQPGNDYNPSGTPATVPDMNCFVIGRSAVAPGTGTFEGPAQDISIYTTFIQVK